MRQTFKIVRMFLALFLAQNIMLLYLMHLI